MYSSYVCTHALGRSDHNITHVQIVCLNMMSHFFMLPRHTCLSLGSHLHLHESNFKEPAGLSFAIINAITLSV